ncbi:hypothetical protein HDU99_000695, partial [Rhizoclosmatium hyalinum]
MASSTNLRHQRSQTLQERPAVKAETPPPPYEGSDPESSESSPLEGTTEPQTTRSNTATISMIKSRLAKQKSIGLLRRMSSVSQELGRNDAVSVKPAESPDLSNSLQLLQMEKAMNAITETQAKLAEMVEELKLIALATGLKLPTDAAVSADNASSNMVEPEDKAINFSERIVEPLVQPPPKLERSPSTTLRRKRASINLSASIAPYTQSKLSSVMTLPPTSSPSGGTVFYDPDDTKQTQLSQIARRASSYHLKSAYSARPLLRRHSSFVAAPTGNSFQTPSNLRDTRDSQSKLTNEATIPEELEKLLDEKRITPIRGLQKRKSSHNVSYVDWFAEETEKVGDVKELACISADNQLAWGSSAILSEVSALCDAAANELLDSTNAEHNLAPGKHGDTAKSEEKEEEEDSTVLHNVLGALLKVLAPANQHQPELHSVVPAATCESDYDGELKEFVKPTSRLRRISFDDNGNEVDGGVLERAQDVMKELEIKVATNNADFL